VAARDMFDRSSRAEVHCCCGCTRILTLLVLVEGIVVGGVALGLFGLSMFPTTRWLLIPLSLNVLVLLSWCWVEFPRRPGQGAVIIFYAVFYLYLATLFTMAIVCGLGAFGLLSLDFGIFYVWVGILGHAVLVSAITIPYTLTLRNLLSSGTGTISTNSRKSREVDRDSLFESTVDDSTSTGSYAY
jgi:hypothetical protein